MLEACRGTRARYISNGESGGPRAENRPADLSPAELEEVLSRRIEQGHTAGQIAAGGFDPETVNRVVRRVERAEPARRQTPVVLEVSTRAFGPGRRMPLVRRYP
jgi:hypothetical protein